MSFSVIACEILDLFRQSHRLPGARMTIAEIDERLGTDPAVAVAIRELINAGYLVAPDASTVKLTARGFDAIHGGNCRLLAG
ncbi:hypothetical protein [Microvirga arsenatis]|uniref:MarR family transcriptional regulator n=1 Tax=Microvirga arsenatis TaxID=2692265 RepID=A0ABW9Z2U0_9HYPH|nr:hypothetical protein [Microvirga arsenatis]NBJ13461.1 hypothetical protein [Microvirga arsenatis]NBJ27001.1 hypothetical protein [Microvirga arsenatis]